VNFVTECHEFNDKLVVNFVTCIHFFKMKSLFFKMKSVYLVLSEAVKQVYRHEKQVHCEPGMQSGVN
jgi:hypothetical protein